jgi:hypothetical protein
MERECANTFNAASGQGRSAKGKNGLLRVIGALRLERMNDFQVKRKNTRELSSRKSRN